VLWEWLDMYDEDEIEDKYIKYNLTIKNNESNEQRLA
jgi:hypothetical protein